MLADAAVSAKKSSPGFTAVFRNDPRRRAEGGELNTDRIRELIALSQGNILDLRATEVHEKNHLHGSTSLPLEPRLALQSHDRCEAWLSACLPSILLPPRHEPLLVVAEEHDMAGLAAAHLASRGRSSVMSMALDCCLLESLPADLLRKGHSDHTLWRPPDFLRRWEHLLPPPATGGVLDLACGSGRAAVWLAMRGWRVTGIDHQCEALDLAARLGACHGVRLDLRTADLRSVDSLPTGKWAAILMFRFLERGIVSLLPSRLESGGVVMLSTFRDAPGFLGNPRPIHRLRRDEAARFWPADQMDILVHQEGFDGDGRPTAGIVGRRH